MSLSNISHQALAFFPAPHGVLVVKIGHALKKEFESPFAERGLSCFDDLQMLATHIAR